MTPTVAVRDTAGVMCLLEQQVQARLPLLVHWPELGTTRVQTACTNVSLVPFDAASLALAKADPHRAPLLHVCLVTGEDVPAYRQNTRPLIEDWLRRVREIPDARWLILHFTTHKKGGFKGLMRGDNTVFDKIRGEWSPKPLELCLQLPLATLHEPDGAGDPWQACLGRMQLEIGLHCHARLLGFDAAIQRLQGAADLAVGRGDADTCALLLCQDGLGLTLQSLGLHHDALLVYTAAEDALQRFLAVRHPPLDWARKAEWLGTVSAAGLAKVGVAGFLDTQLYREAVRMRATSITELLHYIFLRKASQWLRLGRVTALLQGALDHVCLLQVLSNANAPEARRRRWRALDLCDVVANVLAVTERYLGACPAARRLLELDTQPFFLARAALALLLANTLRPHLVFGGGVTPALLTPGSPLPSPASDVVAAPGVVGFPRSVSALMDNDWFARSPTLLHAPTSPAPAQIDGPAFHDDDDDDGDDDDSGAVSAAEAAETQASVAGGNIRFERPPPAMTLRGVPSATGTAGVVGDELADIVAVFEKSLALTSNVIGGGSGGAVLLSPGGTGGSASSDGSNFAELVKDGPPSSTVLLTKSGAKARSLLHQRRVTVSALATEGQPPAPPDLVRSPSHPRAPVSHQSSLASLSLSSAPSTRSLSAAKADAAPYAPWLFPTMPVGADEGARGTWYASALGAAVVSFRRAHLLRHALGPTVRLGDFHMTRREFDAAAAHFATAARAFAEEEWFTLEFALLEKLAVCQRQLQQAAQLLQTCVRLVSRHCPLAPAIKVAYCHEIARLGAVVADDPVTCLMESIVDIVSLSVLGADDKCVTADKLYAASPVPVNAPLVLKLVVVSHAPVPQPCDNVCLRFSDVLSDTVHAPTDRRRGTSVLPAQDTPLVDEEAFECIIDSGASDTDDAGNDGPLAASSASTSAAQAAFSAVTALFSPPRQSGNPLEVAGAATGPVSTLASLHERLHRDHMHSPPPLQSLSAEHALSPLSPHASRSHVATARGSPPAHALQHSTNEASDTLRPMPLLSTSAAMLGGSEHSLTTDSSSMLSSAVSVADTAADAAVGSEPPPLRRRTSRAPPSPPTVMPVAEDPAAEEDPAALIAAIPVATPVVVKPTPQARRTRSEWSARALSSPGLSFVAPGRLVLQPGRNTLTLHGMALQSGIFSATELTIEAAGLRLCGYRLPTCLFRVQASPQFHVALDLAQPLTVTLNIDCGRYHVAGGVVTLTSTVPGVLFEAPSGGGDSDGTTTLDVPFPAPAITGGVVVLRFAVRVTHAAGHDLDAVPLQYLLAYTLAGAMEANHRQLGTVTLPLVHAFSLHTRVKLVPGGVVLQAEALVRCAVPVMLEDVQLVPDTAAVKWTAYGAPLATQPALHRRTHAGQLWGFVWRSPHPTQDASTSHGHHRELAGRVAVTFSHNNHSSTLSFPVQITAPPVTLAARVVLTATSPAECGRPTAASVVFYCPVVPTHRVPWPQSLGYEIFADPLFWVMVGRVRGPLRFPTVTDGETHDCVVALQLVPRRPGLVPLPRVRVWEHARGYPAQGVRAVPVDLLTRGELVRVLPASCHPAPVWHGVTA